MKTLCNKQVPESLRGCLCGSCGCSHSINVTCCTADRLLQPAVVGWQYLVQFAESSTGAAAGTGTHGTCPGCRPALVTDL